MIEILPATRVKSVAGLVGSILFLDSVFYAAVVPILGRLSHEFALSTDQAGLLVGAYAAGTLLGAYPGAWSASRLGPRRSVLLGLCGLASGCVLFAAASSFTGLELARLLQGLGGACSWTADSRGSLTARLQSGLAVHSDLHSASACSVLS